MTREKAQEITKMIYALPDEYTAQVFDFVQNIFNKVKVGIGVEKHNRTIASHSRAQSKLEKEFDDINSYLVKVSPDVAQFRMENRDFYTNPQLMDGFDEEIDRVFDRSNFKFEERNVWEE